jgi:gliding motility-associated lipoprotein GldH
MVFKTKKLLFLLCCCFVVVLLGSCDSRRVFEGHKTFASKTWMEDSLAVFTFKVNGPDPVNIHYTIRNNEAYPFCNLYVTYYLYSAAGKLLSSSLHNIPIADPVTGEPYGDGLGGVYDSKLLALPGYKFPKAGNYKLKIKQYMRQNPLPGIEAFGIRVESVD